MKAKVDLSSYNNSWYTPGGGRLKRIVWYFINALVFNTYLLPINGLKTSLLRLFGAKVGKGVVVKPKVNIKYPWKLTIGNYSWIGEQVWIDNLAEVTIGNHVCISQGAFLLCGNHNYKKSTFDLMVSPITIEAGAWVGAKAVVCPGAVLEEHSVLSISSVLKGKTEENKIYSGNPAVLLKDRIIGA